MKILICDDERIFAEKIKSLIVEFHKKTGTSIPDIEIYTSGEDIIEKKINADIAFVDVELEGIGGICVSEILQKNNPDIFIFIVTSFQEYLDEAMKIKVFRYLTKPVDKNRFFRNYRDCLNMYVTSNTNLVIETKCGVELVKDKDIIMIELSERKVYIYTVNGKYESVNKFDYWCKLLNKASFFRTHRSYIVNLKHVKSFDHYMVYMLESEYSAYLTKRKYSEFKKAFYTYVFNIGGNR